MNTKMSLTLTALVTASAALVTLATAKYVQAAEAATELAIENYQEADNNGDGNLTLDEFTSFINLNADDGLGRASMIRDRGMHGFAFRRIDANSDGLVTPDEMSAMAQ